MKIKPNVQRSIRKQILMRPWSIKQTESIVKTTLISILACSLVFHAITLEQSIFRENPTEFYPVR